MEMEYKEQLAPRQRAPWALIIGPGDEIEVFPGKTVPGKVAVVGTDYRSAGKWSSCTYHLVLASGVRFLYGHYGFETGTFLEGLRKATGKPTNRWHEVANALGVSLPAAEKFLRNWKPDVAKKLDQVESDLASIDEAAPEGAATLALTYGAPTRAAIKKGFWKWPVRVLDADGQEIGRISPDGIPSGKIRIINRETSAGHGGGYVSLLIAAPEGCRAVHGPAPEEKEEFEAEDRLRLKAAAEKWLRAYGKTAANFAAMEFPFGRERILAEAKKRGCPIPAEFSFRARDLEDFLEAARQ